MLLADREPTELLQGLQPVRVAAAEKSITERVCLNRNPQAFRLVYWNISLKTE